MHWKLLIIMTLLLVTTTINVSAQSSDKSFFETLMDFIFPSDDLKLEDIQRQNITIKESFLKHKRIIQTQLDKDYPAFFTGETKINSSGTYIRIQAPKITSRSKTNLESKYSLDKGIPIIDKTEHIYSRENVSVYDEILKKNITKQISTPIGYKTLYINPDIDQDIWVPIPQQGVIQIGFNSSIIEVSDFTPGTCILDNCSFGTNGISLGNVNVTIDDTVLSYRFQTDCVTDESDSALSASASGTFHNHSCQFDGLDDYISITDQDEIKTFAGNPGVTFISWVKPKASWQSDILQIFSKNRFNEYSANRFHFNIIYTNGVDTGDGAFGGTALIDFNPSTKNYANITFNNWTLVIMTANNTDLHAESLYTCSNKGQLTYNSAGRDPGQTINGNVQPNTDTLYLGRYAGSNADNWNGWLDEIKIINRTLDYTEREELCNAGYFHKEGNYTSEILDFNTTQEFTNASWTYETPQLDSSHLNVTLRFRTSTDNITYTDWTDEYTDNTEGSISVTDGRYIQFMAVLRSDRDYESPILTDVSIQSENATTTCDCPSSGDWIINDGSDCYLDTTCDIPTNKLVINSGTLHISSSGNLVTSGCFVQDGNHVFVEDGGTLFCG